MRDHKLVFSGLFADPALRINYIDVGARGDIGVPWSLFDERSLRVIGFEPDPAECARLAARYPSRIYYPHALWGSTGSRTFYLNEWESTSSMYPPNEVGNRAFAEQHWTGRVPKAEIAVECVPMDDVLAPEDAPDFVKLDTQGSEFEILKGSERTLRENHPLVLAETWCAEVYKGAPLCQDIVTAMHGLGYEVFDLGTAAAWSYRSPVVDVHCKARKVGFDLLFMKRPEVLESRSVAALIKFAGLAELFGFRDYAASHLHNSRYAKEPLVRASLAQLQANNRFENSWQRRVKSRLARLLRRETALWPRLH